MRITANGVALNVLESGAARADWPRPALVFLHYFGGSARTWTEVVEQLSNRYRCLAVDLRGFGDSGAAPDDDYHAAVNADDVAAVVAAAGVGDYALVGHSMGGKFALALAARRPENLRSLILLAPSPPTPEPMSDEDRANLLRARGDRRRVEELVRQTVLRPLPAAIFARTVEDDLRVSPAAWRAWPEKGSRENIAGDAARVVAPTLVVAGAEDCPLTAELLRREVVARVAGARLATIPGVKHLLPLEAPAAVAELIDGEVKESSSDAT